MKTAVSIPDDVFEKVERLARRSRRSRSEVFSAALREYVARHAPDEVTDAMRPHRGRESGVPEGRIAPGAREDGMVVAQGEVWWADLGTPHGSAPGFRRPVIVVQGDALNRRRIATVVVVPLLKP